MFGLQTPKRLGFLLRQEVTLVIVLKLLTDILVDAN